MNKELVVLKNPKSATSEAIRILRTNLQFSFIDDSFKTLMVTSSMPGEGKSFISANLALAFGMIDFKVLLIDCDLRKGRQSKLFDLSSERGLSNLLLDDISKYKKYINKTKTENLYVLPSGVVPPNPSEILGSDKFKELLKKLEGEYDLIILDCPPLNVVTDSLVLAKLADQAVIVSAYKKTPMDLLVTSKKALEASNIKIAGVVLNNLERHGNSYYYNKYNKYYK